MTKYSEYLKLKFAAESVQPRLKLKVSCNEVWVAELGSICFSSNGIHRDDIKTFIKWLKDNFEELP